MWKLTLTRPPTAQMERSRVICGGRLPRFMSVSSVPRLSTKSARSTRFTMGGGLSGPMWTPMKSGWSIGKAPLPSTVVVTGAPMRSASARMSFWSL